MFYWSRWALPPIVCLLFASFPGRSEEVISATKFHLCGHSRPATIEIVMTDGRFFHDEELWCGAGQKWEGQFECRVRLGRRVLARTPMNRLFFPKEPSMPMSFWAPQFRLVMRDYNSDGRIDFNLGQYGACVYNNYRIFTIEPKGTVRELPMAGDASEGVTVSWAYHQNSTCRIKLSKGLLTTSWYNHEGADIVEERIWKHHQFVLLHSKPVDYDDDRENGPKW
jgi:hypothetical protein